jgi:hypothetical protein
MLMDIDIAQNGGEIDYEAEFRNITARMASSPITPRPSAVVTDALSQYREVNRSVVIWEKSGIVFSPSGNAKRVRAGQSAGRGRVDISRTRPEQYVPPRVSLLPSASVKSPPSRDAALASLSRAYRWLWIAMSVVIMAWGVVAGASLFANIGVSRPVAIFGIAALVGLAVTLSSAGKDSAKRVR